MQQPFGPQSFPLQLCPASPATQTDQQQHISKISLTAGLGQAIDKTMMFRAFLKPEETCIHRSNGGGVHVRVWPNTIQQSFIKESLSLPSPACTKFELTVFLPSKVQVSMICPKETLIRPATKTFGLKIRTRTRVSESGGRKLTSCSQQSYCSHVRPFIPLTAQHPSEQNQRGSGHKLCSSASAANLTACSAQKCCESDNCWNNLHIQNRREAYSENVQLTNGVLAF